MGSRPHVTFALSRTAEGRRAESGQSGIKPRAAEQNKCCVRLTEGGDGYLPFINMLRDKTQTLSRSHRTVKVLRVKRRGLKLCRCLNPNVLISAHCTRADRTYKPAEVQTGRSVICGCWLYPGLYYHYYYYL